MKKTSILAMAMVLALTVGVSAAWAHGPYQGRGGYNGYHMMDQGYGPGGYHMNQGYGPGGYHMMGPGYGPGRMWNDGTAETSKFWEETAELRKQIYDKQVELNNVLSADKVDEGQAKQLQADINKLRNEMSEKRLAANLEFRKNNPDYQGGTGQGYRGGFGPGYHHGYGPGNQRGYGPGNQRGYGPGNQRGYGPGNQRGYGPGYCWR